MFVVVLVPALVVVACVIPCLIYILRVRHRRKVRFMSTYEDLTGHNTSDVEYQDNIRHPYADTVASDSRYDMSSIPSASMVHLDIVQRRARAESRAQSNRLPTPVEDPFSDRPDDSDASAPLFAGHERTDSRATRTRSPSTVSSRPPSRWGARTPSSTGSRNKGGFAPVPTSESTSGARGGPGLPAQLEVDLSSPFEWDGMEDPFADPNKHSVD